ncbi:MAG: NlpC/P60 family protein [Glaciihabitans sp.]|nr:NlpC/P60 family protein [Glaciihabitans sp.]
MTKLGPTSSTSEFEDVLLPEIPKPANFRRKSSILSTAATAVIIPGLFATMALPAYGATVEPTPAQEQSAARSHDIRVASQTVVVPATAIAAGDVIHRDSFSATSVASLRASHRSVAVASGPSVMSFLANPPYPNFNLSRVASVAQKYLGVPYVFGGASPSGFDCSGLTMYVYAQFGISLPHSSAAQAAMGTAISRADARPGDLVVMDGGSHIGIYLGGGRMIDAPEPGRVVTARAIYDNNYYIVRIGI